MENWSNFAGLKFKKVGFVLLTVTIILSLFIACKKDATTTDDGIKGLAKGECRIIKINKEIFGYNNTGQVTSAGNYIYTYTSDTLKLTNDSTEEMLKFALNAAGFPKSLSIIGFTDSVPSEKWYFYYNSTNNLIQTTMFKHNVNKYDVEGKNVYTWANGNLTKILYYGSDTTKIGLQYNVAYDLTQKDTRKSSFEKSFLFEPIYTVDLIPGVACTHLPNAVQEIVTGGTNTFNKIVYIQDAKSNVTHEIYKDALDTVLYKMDYEYQCN